MSKQTKPDQFEPRVRFNWGFHEATADLAQGRKARDVSAHFDPSYAAGFVAGAAEFRSTGVRNESSEPAWQRARSAEKAAAEQRKAQRAARPSSNVVRV